MSYVDNKEECENDITTATEVSDDTDRDEESGKRIRKKKKTMAVNFKLVWIYFCAPRITNLLGPYYMLLYRCFYDKLQL